MGVAYRSVGIEAVPAMCCGINILILEEMEDPWLHTIVLGSIVPVVQKLEVIVLRTYHYRELGDSVLTYQSVLESIRLETILRKGKELGRLRYRRDDKHDPGGRLEAPLSTLYHRRCEPRRNTPGVCCN